MNHIRWQYFLGALFIGFQLCMILTARFHPMRYCCWAPFDSMNHYRIDVVRNGQSLSDQEIQNRYHLKKTGFDQRSIQHVKDIVLAVERKKESNQNVHITMQYVTNSLHCYEWSLVNGVEGEIKLERNFREQLIPEN